ncbi:MAG: polymer-forming cytoskeletal protein [Candidatus Marinimicrobia bacterium]|nr:polymer-forming cytoskeletal protein [Candidatus Neomarinimicrobiota bacterium]
MKNTGKIDFHNVHTMIGADAEVTGDLSLSGGTIVYGIVRGNISTNGPVRVARTGAVYGNIDASDIHVGGSIEGNIHVKNRAELGLQSTLIGNLECAKLLIEEGATFEGKCDMPIKKDESEIK